MPAAEPRVLLVKFSASFGESVTALLSEARLRIEERDPKEEGSLPRSARAVVVLAGGAEPEGLDWIERNRAAEIPRYLIGASLDHRLAAGAISRGARDYFALPGDLDLLRRTVERIAREAEAALAVEGFAEEERQAAGFDAIIGRSAPLLASVAHAKRVAAVRDVTVLIGGETGTGKEVLARAIHYHSPRSRQPFVEINCAAIPANLLESELFGHERGAFTGAVAAKSGLFELADGGTIFLDEIGQLPLELQPKLLRALESREIRRVGGQTIRRIDIRVIGATHVDLAQAVAGGTFREDLYYRLNVVHLVLPPLRARDGDVELLAEAFAAKLAARYSLPVPILTPEVRSALRAHPWPGNIRELRNAIERSLVLSPPGTLDLADLLLPEPVRDATGGLPFPAPLGTIIRAAILATLERVDGNKSEAARRLGISRPRLQRILDGDTE
jgi:two-component system response regulator HydG